ncbi:MAG: leucine-rich repeat domain-containing protein, partial [Clostridia bacterium]|nr:leucine-rich repeat domain-containing protein [Clostridia bacterium]
MKKCISFILAFVFVIGICASTPITFSANAASVGDLTFELTEDGNSYIVTECAKSATGIIEVPSVYENKPVVIIDDWAFQDCRNITEIKLPDTILTIGIAAFKGCKNLTTINYPKSLVDAANSMFSECEKLTSITVPEGVKVIPGSMFDGATYLTEITLPATLEVIGDWAFRDCVGLTELKLSDSVKEIGIGAFQGCKNLTTINYPKSLIDAANSMFSECEKLTSITVPEGVKTIPASMFWGATYLTEINIPVSLEIIDDWAFRDCTGLTEIKLPISLKEVHLGAFQGCTSLKTVTYQGFAKQWENIDISSSNEPLTSATIVCLDHTHSYKETILKQPTCTEKGEKAYVCECGYTYTGDIKALGHNYSKDFTIDKQPTYEKIGSKSRHCTRCDAKTDVTVIPKLVLGVPVVSQKNTAKGITVTWNAVENAEKYIVYQRVYNKTTKKYSGWKAIKTTTDLTYTDTTVKLGTKYSYTVKAVT